jgi:putative membrane protein
LKRARKEPLFLLAMVGIGLVVSGIAPRSRVTWLLEVSPVIVGVGVMVATYKRFPLTPLAYRLAFLLACLLMIGGHYTFSRVPFGLEAKKILGLKRNDYDRVVHFTSGMVASVLGYELLRRKTRYRHPGWLFFFVVSGVLAGAAFYEFLEWWVARLSGSTADAFLATQGDRWDTQWDMFLTFLGGIAGQLFLRRQHERELEAIHHPRK